MGYDASGNAFYQNNDLLTGGDGNDIIVGDAYLESGQLPDDILSPSHTEPSRLDLDTSISLSSHGSFEIGNEPGVYIPIEGGVIEDNFFSTFDDIIDGGLGYDIAKYNGVYTNYTITDNNGLITIEDTVGDEGTDQLSNIEEILDTSIFSSLLALRMRCFFLMCLSLA